MKALQFFFAKSEDIEMACLNLGKRGGIPVCTRVEFEKSNSVEIIEMVYTAVALALYEAMDSSNMTLH